MRGNPTLRCGALYGITAGLIIIVSMVAGLELAGIGSQWVGYLIMLLALSLIYVGVRRHRDTDCGGVIGFWPALGLGLVMTGFASLAYVAVWEAYLFATDYQFYDAYAADSLNAAGLSDAQRAQRAQQVEQFRALYANPLTRMLITLTEIVPVGVLVSLITAGLLRSRSKGRSGAATQV
ncbi:MAG: DUF4199 domain-containing protein [Maricaulaceae bacterium]